MKINVSEKTFAELKELLMKMQMEEDRLVSFDDVIQYLLNNAVKPEKLNDFVDCLKFKGTVEGSLRLIEGYS